MRALPLVILGVVVWSGASPAQQARREWNREATARATATADQLCACKRGDAKCATAAMQALASDRTRLYADLDADASARGEDRSGDLTDLPRDGLPRTAVGVRIARCRATAFGGVLATTAGFVDKICACRTGDRRCAERVNDTIVAYWKSHDDAIKKERAWDADDVAANAVLNAEMTRCGLPKPVMTKWTSYRDRTCACRTAACVDGVEKDREKWLRDYAATMSSEDILGDDDAKHLATIRDALDKCALKHRPSTTGVAECDAMLATYEKLFRCDKFKAMPIDAQEAQRRGLESMRQALKFDNAAARDAARPGCRAAHDALDKSLAAMGCPP
jgi:hypothetical protein